MWVGGQVTASGPIRLDVPATRQTRLVSHERKIGSTGPLLLVVLEHTIRQAGAIVLTERQDVIYRTAGRRDAGARPGGDRDAGGRRLGRHRDADHDRCCSASPRSPSTAIASTSTASTPSTRRAIPTWSSTGHSPRSCWRCRPARRLERPLTSFEFRARAPLFVDQPITISGSRVGRLGGAHRDASRRGDGDDRNGAATDAVDQRDTGDRSPAGSGRPDAAYGRPACGTSTATLYSLPSPGASPAGGPSAVTRNSVQPSSPPRQQA